MSTITSSTSSPSIQTNCNNGNPTGGGRTTSSQQHPDHHHHHHWSGIPPGPHTPTMIRAVLSALAFEHASLPHHPRGGRKRNSFTTTATELSSSDRTDDDEGLIPSPPLEMTPSLSLSPTQSVVAASHTLLHGKIDVSGDVIEVYFDAVDHHYDDLEDSCTNEEQLQQQQQQQHHSNESYLPAGAAALTMRGGNQSFRGDDGDSRMYYMTPRESPNPEQCPASALYQASAQQQQGIPPPPPPLAFTSSDLPLSSSSSSSSVPKPLFPPPPLPPTELPFRFLGAGKGDAAEGQRRYEATLAWRREHGMDTILQESHPSFDLIKQHYPHYYHFRGKNNEPVFYELPPKTNLKALRAGGVTIPTLLRHYAMVTEFGWQYLEPSDNAKSLYIIDLDGIKITDFVGECVDFVRRASEFTSSHYPERAGTVFIINVPSWFKLIWNVVKPWIDEVTLHKIFILRGRDEILQKLRDKIEVQYIPTQYGGLCTVPWGESPEEVLLQQLMQHNQQRQGEIKHAAAAAAATTTTATTASSSSGNNNQGATVALSCGGWHGHPPCRFCSFCPVRSY